MSAFVLLSAHASVTKGVLMTAHSQESFQFTTILSILQHTLKWCLGKNKVGCELCLLLQPMRGLTGEAESGEYMISWRAKVKCWKDFCQQEVTMSKSLLGSIMLLRISPRGPGEKNKQTKNENKGEKNQNKFPYMIHYSSSSKYFKKEDFSFFLSITKGETETYRKDTNIWM